jgi:hypothetical protein
VEVKKVTKNLREGEKGHKVPGEGKEGLKVPEGG